MGGWVGPVKDKMGLPTPPKGGPPAAPPATHRYFTGAHRVFVLDLDTNETTVVAGDGTAGYVSMA